MISIWLRATSSIKKRGFRRTLEILLCILEEYWFDIWYKTNTLRWVDVNHALLHVMNKYYLNENSFKFVYDGTRNIFHRTNILDFLIKKFHFRKLYCELEVIYNRRFGLLVKIAYFLKPIIQKLPAGAFARKIKTIILQEQVRRSFTR